MVKLSLFILLASACMGSTAQDKPAYRIFNSDGKAVTYNDMVKRVSGADAVFFGELHDDPVAHWLELEVTKSLFALKGTNLVLGAEMFESDNQLLLDEYLDGEYDASKFEAEVKLWKNYKTDYKPLVEFAKTNKLAFIATNVPRRYASVVNKNGFEGLDSLPEESERYIAPRPFPYDPEVKCYKDMMSMGAMGGAQSHVSENFPKAQAIKDATMAHFININWVKGKTFLHYNGSYHSRNYEGILWYLKKFNPGMKFATIETVQQKEIEKLDKENTGGADFIIAIPSSMTRTY
jgi:uncharacterized iron-regulated protein